MIVTEKNSWLRLVFAIRCSSLKTTWPRIAVVTLFATAVTIAVPKLGIEEYSLTTTPFSLIGLAMAIFLGFRNSASYDRFWEGRKLWGGLVNVSRSFTRQTWNLIVPASEQDREAVQALQRRVVHATIAYVHSLKHHLRGSDPGEELRQYLPDDQQTVQSQSNVPIAILQLVGEWIREAWQAGHIHDLHVPVLEASLTEMTALQGGCERIRSTPVPFTYNVLIHRIVAVYCLAMPFGLIATTGTLTPVVVCLISYAFFGLDSIGDDVEQPFERDDNDLPLHAICRTIEINLLEFLGEPDVPEPVQPVKEVLL